MSKSQIDKLRLHLKTATATLAVASSTRMPKHNGKSTLSRDDAARKIQNTLKKAKFKQGLFGDARQGYIDITMPEGKAEAEALFGSVISPHHERKPDFVPVHPDTPKASVYYRSDPLDIYDESWRSLVETYVEKPDYDTYYYTPIVLTATNKVEDIIKAFASNYTKSVKIIEKEGERLAIVQSRKDDDTNRTLRIILIWLGLAEGNFNMKIARLGIKASPLLAKLATSDKKGKKIAIKNKALVELFNQLSKTAPKNIKELKLLALKHSTNNKPPCDQLALALRKLIYAIPDDAAIGNETIQKIAGLLEIGNSLCNKDYSQFSFIVYCIVYEISLLIKDKKISVTYGQFKKETEENATSIFGIKKPSQEANYQFVALPANSGTNALITALQLIKLSNGKKKNYTRIGNIYYEFDDMIPPTGFRSGQSDHKIFAITGGSSVWPHNYQGISVNKVLRKIDKEINSDTKNGKKKKAYTILIDETSGCYRDLKIDDNLKKHIENGSVSLLVHESHQKFGLLHTDQTQYGRVFGICSKDTYPEKIFKAAELGAISDLTDLPDLTISAFISIACGNTLERIKERHFNNSQLFRNMFNELGLKQTRFTNNAYRNDQTSALFVSTPVKSKLSKAARMYLENRSSFGHFNTTYAPCVDIDRISPSGSDAIDTLVEGTTLSLLATEPRHKLARLLNEFAALKLSTYQPLAIDEEIFSAGLIQALIAGHYYPSSNYDKVMWNFALKFFKERAHHLYTRRSHHEIINTYNTLIQQYELRNKGPRKDALELFFINAYENSFPLQSVKSIALLNDLGILDNATAILLSKRANDSNNLNQTIAFLGHYTNAKVIYSSLIKQTQALNKLYQHFDYQVVEHNKVLSIAPKLSVVLLTPKQADFVFKQLSAKERYQMFKLLSQNMATLKSHFPEKSQEIDSILKHCSDQVLNDFKQAYKNECWFSFFGNIGRSEFGKQVFSDQLTSVDQVVKYISKHHEGAAARAFKKLYL